MSATEPTNQDIEKNKDTHQTHEVDMVESIVPMMPIVLPLAGGVLMFLLAFIAIYMA